MSDRPSPRSTNPTEPDWVVSEEAAPADVPSVAPAPQQEFVRFSLNDRIEHFLLFTSFTVLVITGVPQKYLPAGWAEFMIRWMGGIEAVRIVHRIAATIMILESIYHVITISYKIFVRRVSPSMLPGLQDVVDFLDVLRYNLGLARKHPKLDRYSFEHKVEYFAVVWGTVVMVITGFMMWNPIFTTKLLPGSWIPAAKAAHGGEALLAFLAIVIWHVYNVHLKTFNKSIFTGKLTRAQMEDEHAKELERIEKGLVRPEPPREVIRRRERVFLPIAAVFGLIMVIALYVFITIENTAIATVPPQDRPANVFVPASPTPPSNTLADQKAALERSKAQAVPHEIISRENCLSCHGMGAIDPFSPIHANLRLGNETCLGCHKIIVETTALTPAPSAEIPSFATDILPVLQRRCVVCHNLTTELSLLNYRAVMTGTKNGPVVQPGDPEHSRLVLVQEMPAAAHPTRLTANELQQVMAWIQAGAPNN